MRIVTSLKSLFTVLALVMTLGPSAVLLAQQTTPPRVDEFVPISELPPQDQLPAAPLLIAAYVIVIVVFFVYVISIGRRLSAVQRELQQLESTVNRSRRG